MRIFFQGLGKLGLPVALALEAAGHDIAGWDVSEQRRAQILARNAPEAAHEPGVAELLAESKITLAPLWAEQPDPDIVMIAVQTPHQPEFEGCVPLSRRPEDFDYSYLRKAVDEVVTAVRKRAGDPLIVVISTCLPGTFNRELRWMVEGRHKHQPKGPPALRPLRFAYHPLFIAMGQVIEDFRNPEFVLIGHDGQEPPELDQMYQRVFHETGTWPSFRTMSITSAELTKVAYNAWLGYKLMLANGLAELSDKVGANVDDVLGTLKLATDRLVSTRYMDAGMGDGGGCHPRDQIALSRLAKDRGISHDTFDVVVRSREEHAHWLADIWCDEADRSGLPMVMLGDEYKPNTNIRTGSAARLVLHYVRARGREPEVCRDEHAADCHTFCWFLGVPHDWCLGGGYPPRLKGVLVDPWGVFPEHEGLRLVQPGRRA